MDSYKLRDNRHSCTHTQNISSSVWRASTSPLPIRVHFYDSVRNEQKQQIVYTWTPLRANSLAYAEE